MEFYTNELRSSQFYESISRAFINNIKIKIILRIENDEFKVYQNLDEIKALKIQSILCKSGFIQSVVIPPRAKGTLMIWCFGNLA